MATVSSMAPFVPSAEPRLRPANPVATTTHATGAVSRVGAPALYQEPFDRGLFAPSFSETVSKLIVVSVAFGMLCAAFRDTTTDASFEKFAPSVAVATRA